MTEDSYKKAGVDIEAGQDAVDRIKKITDSNADDRVISGIGGFGGLYSLGGAYKDPVLVAATDGVGTKLRLAFKTGIYDTIGKDLVAMCVNDVLCQGAKPLFFLDYLATGKLDPGQVEEIIKGIDSACREAGCALLGGETAEMPGFYPPGEFDVAGFTVGGVERDKIVDGKGIKDGDVLIGLPSTGIHSNGYSLVRKVLLEEEGGGGKYSLQDTPPELDRPLGEELLEPTRIYVKEVGSLLNEDIEIKGMAHITGGGLVENISRILPEGLAAFLDESSWEEPSIFNLIQKEGNISKQEMRRTFNLGIGFVLILGAGEAKKAMDLFASSNEEANIIGKVMPKENIEEDVSENNMEDSVIFYD
ncbi:phosphoribosylformylglycinamidine cyclo-ligase [Natranaerofaba carboxydovora]|uniref:phosphoribosylformylglycinamidine cyclo-ligase n=1 Tax=Natranaerofaba carboxydovora TaxID=2742683 RepID=UPI001F133E61|nr:phosphoribosylformylglycinamidine cyclo-ligase [Natranaerofaba carboxydovora]UMZ74538.1 Phosphoribosylformylglycinamidine cyclo-ligase [Natranaerofaba carboxydovora]